MVLSLRATGEKAKTIRRRPSFCLFYKTNTAAVFVDVQAKTIIAVQDIKTIRINMMLDAGCWMLDAGYWISRVRRNSAKQKICTLT